MGDVKMERGQVLLSEYSPKQRVPVGPCTMPFAFAVSAVCEGQWLTGMTTQPQTKSPVAPFVKGGEKKGQEALALAAGFR
jgi:hypothetical protein